MADKYPSMSPYTYCANNPVKLIDPNGNAIGGDPTKKAKEIIQNFSNTASTSVFKNIPKETFVADLYAHINNPSTIMQGSNGTCGAAVLSKYMAEKHPVLYVNAAISLYKTGSFTNNGVTIKLPQKAFSGTLSDLNRIGINSVDAIMQGALTNYQNIFLDYNPFQDGSGFRSFMYPRYLIKIINDFIGATCNSIFNPSNEEINTIDLSHHFVIGVVHSTSNDGMGFGVPNHYIQILNADNNNIGYWSWGRSQTTKIDPKHNGFYSLISIDE